MDEVRSEGFVVCRLALLEAGAPSLLFLSVVSLPSYTLLARPGENEDGVEVKELPSFESRKFDLSPLVPLRAQRLTAPLLPPA